MNLLSRLLPDATHVRLETWSFEPASSAITITLHTRQTTARCPLCGRGSKRVHSRYERTLADLPWGEYAVTVRLKVRRLFCDASCCERRLFAERLPGNQGYRAIIHPPLENFPSDSPVADAEAFNRMIEDHARGVPEQYLWIHKRFKGLTEDYPDYYGQRAPRSA